ncbi:hypothetical protein [Bacillus sp. JJ1562]|uniref:hypothetical protein n=1 Tax=Bacillus sp. JJ1562 TaxID=3122960 RepID=UPI0030023247
MAVYEFIACNQKLSSFEKALADEEIKSYNELLKMGFTAEQIQIRGINLSKIDRNIKVFYIKLPEELHNSPLQIEEDFKNPYARFLTEKKFIYRVTGVEKAVSHLAGYIGKYANTWKELELWRVMEDDYSVEDSLIPKTVISLHYLTLEKLEVFYEGSVPNCLILVQN